MSFRQSDIFEGIFIFWKIFGLWSGRVVNKYYIYYSAIYIFLTLVIYDALLTLNLAFTPLEIEYLIEEVIFYFTEITVMSKVLMMYRMRDKILEAFKLMDAQNLASDDEISKKIIEKSNAGFKSFWKFFNIFAHIGYSIKVFLPIILYFVFNTELDLPICKYYFLTYEQRDRYFVFWFFYQSLGIYGHMIYNITVDTFFAGLLLNAVTQLRILNVKISNLRLSDEEKKMSVTIQEKIQALRLRNCLTRYNAVLKYCDSIQKVLHVIMFVVFTMSSMIICVVLCRLLWPTTTETFVFMVTYSFVMIMQIYMPGYLGSLLSYESQELVFAAYRADWIPRAEPFKKSIKIFVERAKKPIQITALSVFPLSLSTFASIVKTAYSFFALVRSFKSE